MLDSPDCFIHNEGWFPTKVVRQIEADWQARQPCYATSRTTCYSTCAFRNALVLFPLSTEEFSVKVRK